MKATPTTIRDVLIIEPQVFGDDRGFFFASFNQAKFEAAIGRHVAFVQDNHSWSVKNVLHYQIQHPQGKLVRVVQGAVLDVAVDLRKSSPTFGQYSPGRFVWCMGMQGLRLFWRRLYGKASGY